MLSLLVSSLSSLTCYVFPLLLTLKSINSLGMKGGPDDCIVKNTTFLMNYWICYTFVNYIQGTLIVHLISAIGAGVIIESVFFVVKLWLFYGHGCLVVTYVCPGFVNHHTLGYSPNFEYFEGNVIEPLISLIKDNRPVQRLINLGFLLACKLSSSSNIASGYCQSVKIFCDALTDDKSFLQSSLNYICYIDNPDELRVRYISVKKKINSAGVLNLDSFSSSLRNLVASSKPCVEMKPVRKTSLNRRSKWSGIRNSHKERSETRFIGNFVNQVKKDGVRSKSPELKAFQTPKSRSRSVSLSSENEQMSSSDDSLGQSLVDSSVFGKSELPGYDLPLLLNRVMPTCHTNKLSSSKSGHPNPSVGHKHFPNPIEQPLTHQVSWHPKSISPSTQIPKPSQRYPFSDIGSRIPSDTLKPLNYSLHERVYR